MRRLIKDHQIVDNHWFVTQEADHPPPPGQRLLPLAELLAWPANPPAPAASCGVVLQPEDDPQRLIPFLPSLAVVAVNFPVFTDGRGYSIARLLRRWHYQGEIRAIGDVLQDQLYFLHRSGFNAFELRADQDMQDCLSSLDAYRWHTESSLT